MSVDSTPRAPERKRALSTYEVYLHTEQLFTLQKPEGERLHPDELTFQVVHQTIELWWKMTQQQLDTATNRLRGGQTEEAAWALRRAVSAQSVVAQATRQLEFVSPKDFLSFRGILGNGSGADSPGFRAILRQAPPLWEAFAAALERETISLLDLYQHPWEHATLYQCAEALVDFDELFHLFRAQHLKLAERNLGLGAIGTGGTPMPQLERTLRDLLFPLLWTVRDELLAAVQEQTGATTQSGH
ncbi:MAG: tryptophan 2,3-dioxygenase [Ktedonobacterales bacterium]|nr:tryptophan 2,3-dioxygenase [Ktedonobacterales bacterium]